jgi:ASCH domain-containing protein
VLTVRQPWASAIFNAGKDIENRSWTTNYRGRLWIHAGGATARTEPDAWADTHGLWLPEEPLPRGVILGSVQLVDVVRDADSPWSLADQYHWVLREPMVLVRPIEWKGALGLKFVRPPQGAIRPARRSRKAKQ